MKELQSWISNKVYDVVPKTTINVSPYDGY